MNQYYFKNHGTSPGDTESESDIDCKVIMYIHGGFCKKYCKTNAINVIDVDGVFVL